jgi:hypothetical protein
VLELVAKHPAISGASGPARVAAVFAEHNFTPLTDVELEEAMALRLAKLDGSRFPTLAQKARHLCGQVLHDLVGRVDGAKVVQRVNARLHVPAAEEAELRVK